MVPFTMTETKRREFGRLGDVSVIKLILISSGACRAFKERYLSVKHRFEVQM